MLILGLKASKLLCEKHEYKIINYQKAIEIEGVFTLNYGKNLQISLKIFVNS